MKPYSNMRFMKYYIPRRHSEFRTIAWSKKLKLRATNKLEPYSLNCHGEDGCKVHIFFGVID